MESFIYGLYCPVSKCIRYIGKAKNPKRRFAAHLKSAENGVDSHCYKWIRILLEENILPILKIIRFVEEGEDWQELERYYIAAYREAGHKLTNMTSGGDGNHNMHPESLAKMSAALKIQAAKPGAKEKNSEAQKKAWERMKNETPDFVEDRNARISGSMKGLFSDPAIREDRLAKMHSPEAKAKRYAKRDTPEKTAARKEKLKAAWADPERRAKRIAEMHARHKSKKNLQLQQGAF